MKSREATIGSLLALLMCDLKSRLHLKCSSRLTYEPPRSSPNSPDSQMLRPTGYVRPHSAHLLSPSSDIVGPSPVTSNGTETTEIDDEEQEAAYRPAPAEATSSTPQVRLPDVFI